MKKIKILGGKALIFDMLLLHLQPYNIYPPTHMIKARTLCLITLLLLLLLPLTSPQCSAYCSSCNSGSNTTCSNCPSNFQSDPTLTPTCLPDSNVYPLTFEAINGDITASTGDCDTFMGVPGIFATAEQVDLYVTTTMPPHFRMRVRMSVLFIDYWSKSDKVYLYVDNSPKGSTRQYKDINKIGSSSICGDNNRQERYTSIDTNDFTHNSTNLNVSVKADNCDCGGGGGGSCKTCGWMLPDVIIMIASCHQFCLTCYGVQNTQCRSCANDTSGFEYLLTNTTCDVNCSIAYYRSAPNLCSKCATNCTVCDTISTNCSQCATGYVFLPPDSCPKTCPDGYYFSVIDNQCNQCDSPCEKCTDFPMPCQYCAVTYFLLGEECLQPCPSDLYENVVNRTCENCSVYCIMASINFYQPKGTNGLSALYIDMKFTQPITFAEFPMDTFQTISFANSKYTISMFNVTYTPLSSSTYRITLSPIGFAFLVNETITVTVMDLPDPKHNGSDGRPFRDEAYGISASLVWTYVRPPDMTALEDSVVSGFSSASTQLNAVTTQPGVQQFKKFGFLLLMMNSLQITSCLLLLNMILPQNLYEGIRFFASFIFFDVPPWQQESDASKRFVVPPVSTLVSRRMLSGTSLDEYRFRRTGFTNVFVFDCYIQIIVITVTYLMLLGVTLLSRRSGKFKKVRPMLETMLTVFHEIALMYFTLTILFEFSYFDVSKPVRIASLAICILITIYYLGYHVYRFYDLMNYSYAELGSTQYQQLITKYGSILKNIRHCQYQYTHGCQSTIKNYFKPYNYHILSYVKKILMMLTFAVFYTDGDFQVMVLTVLQVGEIVRFCLTWPFAKKWRNVYRLVMEFVLLGVFAVVFAIQRIALRIYGNTPTDQEVRLYFDMGWIGFGLVLIFNFGFLVLFFVDIAIGCKYTNKELIDENRRSYYFQKLHTLENANQDIPVDLVSKFVKKGNLNKRELSNLPNSNLRIELYRICKLPQGYTLQINNVLSARTDTEFNYKAHSNNITPTRFLKCSKLVPQNSSIVYNIVHRAFKTYATAHTHSITIKTFAKIEQRKYRLDQEIDLKLSELSQEVEIESEESENAQTVVLETLMPGFPIPEELLNALPKVLGESMM